MRRIGTAYREGGVPAALSLLADDVMFLDHRDRGRAHRRVSAHATREAALRAIGDA